MIVVDASLAAKLIFDEPGSAAALQFVATHPGDLRGPELLLSGAGRPSPPSLQR